MARTAKIALAQNSPLPGLLLQKRLFVRRTIITESSVRVDSTNHPLLKSVASALKPSFKTRKVSMSKAELNKPNEIINFLIAFISQALGLATFSGSTKSPEIASAGKSVMKFRRRICIGRSGKYGKNTSAIAIETTFPKAALTPTRTYFIVFTKVRLPKRIPSATTLRSLSSSTMDAALFATSTAVFTEMPTSAACNAAASLIPSPKYPTVAPLARKARTIRSF